VAKRAQGGERPGAARAAGGQRPSGGKAVRPGCGGELVELGKKMSREKGGK
jgi:hypothetical protein